MLAVVGTIPDPTIPVLEGTIDFQNGRLAVDGREFSPDRGTPALLAASAVTCRCLQLQPPYAFLVGDEGLGKGSRNIYEYLTRILPQQTFSTLAFHYLQPDVDWHDRILLSIQSLTTFPTLVADAGFMYAAKMSGNAGAYTLFTPDVGELAFLADEMAPHPFYTRGFILQDDEKIQELVVRAYAHQNAAQCLLVKGSTDHIANKEGVLARVSSPSIEAMEAMGGTGDTVTGMACALIESGFDVSRAAWVAAQANRHAGELADLNPASQIGELITHIPAALERALKELQ
ncbi:Carbohydrate kinase [Paucidesulfovibrio gracilis DSM 16080]|uniref:Carbohydrate kinase n=1 Tax=Paucidesulfovibrio gracilis DSM 16080 TaxID=1121449 RepID=A0A1T4XWL3_9BACT|nr:NAD(P)H-hydrate dehydratase [Paucidesulfovibrio gracilis]SKA93793.1 Carbohydrate kinase [Paucidesulfovibrio gracilis DSM 16080]